MIIFQTMCGYGQFFGFHSYGERTLQCKIVVGISYPLCIEMVKLFTVFASFSYLFLWDSSSISFSCLNCNICCCSFLMVFCFIVFLYPQLDRSFVMTSVQVPEFEEAAFNAPLNKVVKCKTKFGWHLLQVLSERYAIKTIFFLNFLKTQTARLHHCIIFCTFANFSLREGSVLRDIQPEELHLKMQDPNFLNEAQLIDVREPEEVYVFVPLLFLYPLFLGFMYVFQDLLLASNKNGKGVHLNSNI